MNYKVVLDPGHGGNDYGAMHYGRQEKDDVLKLALAVGDVLENNDVDVVYTRITDVYHTPFERAEMANNADADCFVSLHRNSALIPNTESGVKVLVFGDNGVRYDLAESINKSLEETGYKNLGITERPSLVVLRKTKMPAVWVEAGYIDNIEDNKRFDSKLSSIAESIAKGIMSTMNEVEEEKPEILYRVQVGAFRADSSAGQLLKQLQVQGFPAFLIYEDGFSKVQVGAFADLENAIRMEQTLRQYGYNTFVTTR